MKKHMINTAAVATLTARREQAGGPRGHSATTVKQPVIYNANMVETANTTHSTGSSRPRNTAMPLRERERLRVFNLPNVSLSLPPRHTHILT